MTTRSALSAIRENYSRAYTKQGAEHKQGHMKWSTRKNTESDRLPEKNRHKPKKTKKNL
jgi:hypothetical protein